MFVSPSTRVVPDRVLVRFRPGSSPTARVAARSDISASVGVAYDLVPGLQLLTLPRGSSVASAVAALSADPNVEYAVPDLVVKAAAVPNDPLYSNQWALGAIGAPQAWDRTTGSASVKVAVLDSGVALSHPDLTANLVPGWNFVSNTSVPADDYGHGTFVTGVIGATGNNGVGVTGVSWHVSLMPLKICDSTGGCRLDREVSALQYAVAHGAKIANASFGGYYGGYQPEEDAIAAAGQAGLLYVAAGGNDTTNSDVDPFYPASYPLDNIISVAATDPSGALSYFSNYGFNSILTAAPGENVFSTMLSSGTLSDPSGYGYLSGTSVAAPQVTGAAALLWAEHPDWTMQQIRMRLLTTATTLASLSGKVGDCGQLNIAAATDPTLSDRGLVCVRLTGTGNGSVASNPAAINCGTSCGESVPSGTTVTLTATPAQGSTFAGWTGACTGVGDCVVDATSLEQVSARFRAVGDLPGWQQKRLPAPVGRDPYVASSIVDATHYNIAVSADGSERAEAIFNPPQFGCFSKTDTGAVFLERRSAGSWAADGEVTAPSRVPFTPVTNDDWVNCANFGSVTQLSADGSTLVVAPYEGSADVTFDPIKPAGTYYRCGAFVYQRGASGWTAVATLRPPGIDSFGTQQIDDCGYFGIDGALSGDGSRIAMLARRPDGSGGLALEADVYSNAQGTWSLEQQIKLPTPNSDCAASIGPGYLSLSGDGAMLLVGSPDCDDSGLTAAGVVYAYTRSGTQWTLSQTIHSPAPASSQGFGYETAMSQDGATAVISTGGTHAPWVFERDQSGWHVSAVLAHPHPPFHGPYVCPTVVQGGARIVCTAQDTVGFDAQQGAVYVYNRPAGGWASQQPQGQEAFASDGLTGDSLGSEIAVPEDGSFIDALISPFALSSGGYPDHRIGYQFTSGPMDKTIALTMAGTGSGSVTSDPAGLSCTSTCTHDFSDSAPVSLTATPAFGSLFAGWSDGCSGSASCAFTMSADHSVTATFVAGHFLSVGTKGTGHGSISSSPSGIACGSTCNVVFFPGTPITLTATPATGSVFTGWSRDCTGTGDCQVTMNQDHSAVATFAVAPETLSVTKGGNGAGTVTAVPSGISCGATCSHDYLYGTVVTLTAKKASGSRFTGWSGACKGTVITCKVTMSQAEGVTATFVLLQTLSVAKSGSGLVTSTPSGIYCGSACQHPYLSGTVVTLAAKAASGRHFTGWSGACTGTGTCRVTMNAATAVTATFAPNSAARADSRNSARTLAARIEELLQRLAQQLELGLR